MKELLREVFAGVLADLDIRHSMQGAVADRLRAMANGGPVLVIAFGKAARAMAQAAVLHLPGTALRGLVVPPEPDAAPLPPFEVIPGGHPLPSEGSLRAARRALEFARSVGAHEQVLFLVSGGGSAMLELPATDEVPLDELRALHRALVGSGADIVAINTVRRHLSAIKGGRLALAAAAARAQLTLAISDVPAQRFAAVASGPTVADATTPADCRDVLDRFALWPAVPAPLRERLRRGDLPPALPPGHTLLQRAEFWTLQDERSLRAHACRRLRRAGVLVVLDTSTDDLPCRAAAGILLRRLDRLRRRHPGRRVAVVATGELAVPLPAEPGTGGRNQQFALQCARPIRGRPIAVLSAGTDGIDGNSPAAGGLVDGSTCARARRLGLGIGPHLARCDAFSLLDRLGDTVVTGPTGTNVRDLRVLLADA